MTKRTLDLDAVQADGPANNHAVSFIDGAALQHIQQLPARPFLPPAFPAPTIGLPEAFEDVRESLSRLFDAFAKVDWTSVFDGLQRIAEQIAKAETVEKTGWLPHHTTPFHLIGSEEVDEAAVGDLIGAYYERQWVEVADAFLLQVDSYDIDAEAKATFREALAIHGAGHYRAAPRLLFPEIERVVSDEFYGGRRHIMSPDGKSKVGITSIPEVRSSAAKLPAGDVLAYRYGIRLFERMEAHLYMRVGDTDEARAKFAADPVPNRHAALHGIVSYRTMQTSLNTLIMTDFLFHIISRIKKHVA